MRARWDRTGDFGRACLLGALGAVLQVGVAVLLWGSGW